MVCAESGKRATQWVLLVITLPLIAVLLWWPNLLSNESVSLGHGTLSLLLAGLCFALACGIGFFQKTSRTIWLLTIAISYAGVIATLITILMIN